MRELPGQEKFGGRLRLARTMKGLTQEDLACLLETSQKIISEYECGKVFPSPNRLKQLADLTNQTTEFFLVECPYCGQLKKTDEKGGDGK